MIERGTLLRGFLALLVMAALMSGAYIVFSDTDGTSGNFLEDGDYRYGPIYEDADGYRGVLLADPWIRSLRLDGGTFGQLATRQVRIGIDGSGPIPSREVTLDTPAAIKLFAKPRRERAEGALRGIERILEEHGGLVRGVSLTETTGEFQAAALASGVRERWADGAPDPASRREITAILQDIARQQANDAYAWYDPRFQDVVLGPEISHGLLRWIRTPKQATSADNIFTAFVLRHELEHTITPIGDDYPQYQWIEEGTAETLARWPGIAAQTARELGMPYPKKYDEVEFVDTTGGGYPEWTATLRVLLGAAGVDWKDPKQYDDAVALLQAEDAGKTAALLADEIAQQNRLTPAQRNRLERDIARLDGDTAAARRIVAKL